jgi:outer membrane cobalamin receptor
MQGLKTIWHKYPFSQKTYLFSAILMGLMTLNVSAEEQLAPVDIISTTPLHGVGIELDKVPGKVETANDQELEQQQSLDLSEFMNQRFGSVYINSAQNNPLQPDLQYRGFVASPLLGLPQGLSVYMDGVRINEPFGDTVSWALIPKSAIANINLISGSNPLFGLNTLGGALSVQTKNGLTHPGSQAELMAGSFGRKTVQFETGGVKDKLNYFLTGSWFDENGWRDFSPSETKQLFGNVGWSSTNTTLDLSLSLADTELIGNGPLPVDLLDQDRKAIFTRPDRTENKLAQIRLGGSHAIGDNTVLEGVAYYRRSDVSSLNGDDSDFEACTDAANLGFICEIEDTDEELALDQNGNPIPDIAAVDGATINRSETDQDT